MSGELGEVEIKLEELCAEIFEKYGGIKGNINEDQSLTQDQIREFIKDVMTVAGEEDAWDDEEFNTCYRQVDYDGGGSISKNELLNFIKRFADV